MSDTPTGADATEDVTAARGTFGPGMMQGMSVTIAVCGLVLIAAPLLGKSSTAGLWNNLVVGVAVVLLGGFNVVRIRRDRPVSFSASALATLLGLWTLVSSVVIGMGSPEIAITNILFGVTIVMLAGLSAGVARRPDSTPRESTRV